MRKKIIIGFAAAAVVVGGVAAMSAFEAHIINVTAHIENALKVDLEELVFGPVFPEEVIIKENAAIISLSDSFMKQERVNTVLYELAQKTKSFYDPFENEIEERWAWIDPDFPMGSARPVPSGGWLSITADDRDDLDDIDDDSLTSPQPDYTAPRLLVPVTTSDWEIQTRVKVDKTMINYQGAGLLAYKSEGNLVRLELVNYGDGSHTSIYMEGQNNYVKTGKGWAHNIELSDVYLKLVKTGNLFTGFYSTNGINWIGVVVAEGSMINDAIGSRCEVGIAVVSNDKSTTNVGDFLTAKFHYFKSIPLGSDGNPMGNLCPYLEKRVNGCDWEHGGVPHSLNITGDSSDDLDLKLTVPPIKGYEGQGENVPPVEGERDYGCDIWIEVTGIQ